MCETRNPHTLLEYPHRARVTFPYQGEIARVLELLKPFLAEDQSYKNTWTVGVDAEEGEPEYGYIRRGNGKDRKEMLHFRKNLTAMLEEQGVDFVRHLPLLRACDELFNACIATARPELAEFARQYSLRYNDGGKFEKEYHELARRGDELFLPVLRVMQYEPDAPGKVVARRHGDHGFVTLHIYASEPGLQFGWNHATMDDFIDAPIPLGSAELFPGRKMAYLTDWKVPALLHQVVATTPNQRQTIVFFDHVDSPKVPRWYQH